MDCTGETLCELCEITVENARLREAQEMKRMQAYDVTSYNTQDEVWDTQP